MVTFRCIQRSPNTLFKSRDQDFGLIWQETIRTLEKLNPINYNDATQRRRWERPLRRSRVSAEQKESEAVAASTGALPLLQKAFSKLANPETNAVSLENIQVLLEKLNNFLILDDRFSFFILWWRGRSVFSAMLQFRSRRSYFFRKQRAGFVSGVTRSLSIIPSWSIFRA